MTMSPEWLAFEATQAAQNAVATLPPPAPASSAPGALGKAFQDIMSIAPKAVSSVYSSLGAITNGLVIEELRAQGYDIGDDGQILGYKGVAGALPPGLSIADVQAGISRSYGRAGESLNTAYQQTMQQQQAAAQSLNEAYSVTPGFVDPGVDQWAILNRMYEEQGYPVDAAPGDLNKQVALADLNKAVAEGRISDAEAAKMYANLAGTMITATRGNDWSPFIQGVGRSVGEFLPSQVATGLDKVGWQGGADAVRSVQDEAGDLGAMMALGLLGDNPIIDPLLMPLDIMGVGLAASAGKGALKGAAKGIAREMLLPAAGAAAAGYAANELGAPTALMIPAALLGGASANSVADLGTGAARRIGTNLVEGAKLGAPGITAAVRAPGFTQLEPSTRVTAGRTASVGPGRTVTMNRRATPPAQPPAAPPAAAATNPPAVPNGRQLPDRGTAGIDSAIAAKRATTETSGSRLGGEGSIRRRIVGAINPSVNLVPETHVHNQARAAVQATKTTDYNRAYQAAAVSVEDAYKAAPPTYVGPADNPFQGMPGDYLQNPRFYTNVSPDLVKAKALWEEAGFNNLADARANYDVDIEFFKPKGDPDGVYVGNFRDPDTQVANVETTTRSLTSKTAIAKDRAYDSWYDRWLKDNDFKPVTDLRQIADVHSRSLAYMAGNNTFKAGLGKTKLQVLDETNPGLSQARDIAARKVQSARESLAKVKERLRRLGVEDRAIEREITAARRGESSIAGRMAELEDDIPELVEMHRQLDEMRAEEAALTKLLDDAEKKVAKAEGASNAVSDVRKVLEAEQARVGEQYGVTTGMLDEARASNRARLTPEQSTARLETKRKALDVRMVALDQLGKKLGLKGAAADARTRKLMDDIAELPPAPTATQIRNMERRVRSAEDRLLSQASKNQGAQQILAQTQTRLINRTDELAEQRARAEARKLLRETQIPQLEKQLEELRFAVKTADTGDYVFSMDTGRWHTPKEAADVHMLNKNRFDNAFIDGVLQGVDVTRAAALGPDFSPLTIQGALGAFGYPEVLIRHGFGMAKALFSNADDFARNLDPDLLRRYEFATGRQAAELGPEFAVSRAAGREARLPGRPVKRFNDALNRAVTYGQVRAFENDSNLLMKMGGKSRELADAEAANMVNKIIPRIDQVGTGRSVQRGKLERMLQTSISFTVQPFNLAKDYGSAVTKVMSGRPGELLGREKLALVRGNALGGSIATYSVMSAVASAQANNQDVGEAIKEVLDPNSPRFMHLILGSEGSIALGGPFRRAFMGAYRTTTPLFPGGKPAEDAIPAALRYLRGGAVPIIGSAYDIAVNRDWRGRPIREGSPLQQVAGAAEHLLQNANILGGGIMEGAKEGGLKGGAFGAAEGLSGANYMERSIYDDTDRKIRDLVQRGNIPATYLDKDGNEKPVRTYWDLRAASPEAAEQFDKDHPDLKAKRDKAASELTQKANELRTGLYDRQEKRDADLLSTNPREWRAASSRDHSETGIRLDQMYTDAGDYSRPDATLLDVAQREYHEGIQAATGPDGKVNWDMVDRVVGAMSPEKQRLLFETRLKGETEARKQYMQDLNVLSPYFEQRDNAWKELSAGDPNLGKYSTFDDFRQALIVEVHEQGIGWAEAAKKVDAKIEKYSEAIGRYANVYLAENADALLPLLDKYDFYVPARFQKYVRKDP